MAETKNTRISRRHLLTEGLEKLCRSTDFKSRIPRDPVSFLHRFRDPRDIEIVGWILSSLAYGRVPLFQSAMEDILKVMDAKPYEYAMRFDPGKDLKHFQPLYYRVSRGEDIACLLYFIQQILLRHRSIGKFFSTFYRNEEPDIGGTLERFLQSVMTIDPTPIYGNQLHPPGLRHFFPSPKGGSACKRVNLFLRWMIRPKDGLDLGVWRDIPASKLVIPLDTHVLRIGRYLGLTARRTGGWKTAVEITENLRKIDPKDPLRFDFPICHLGISGRCPSKKDASKCIACPLSAVCSRGRALLRGGALVR